MRKYKIGITFNLEAKVTDIWANGANQNVIHLFSFISTFVNCRRCYSGSWDQKAHYTSRRVYA